jgi:hypothetical protein
MIRFFSSLQKRTWLPLVVSMAAVLLFAAQAFAYARIQTSFVDEGGYLFLGYQYASGSLEPFQDFGAPRWYPPLAYLIPGWFELLFGPGLLTGRIFSVACALIMLVPLWLTTRRLAGNWWAAAVMWSLTLTPIAIQVYSLALSQALVACLLCWVLFFTLGQDRRGWQILVGSLLAGLTVMVRHTMLPLLPLLVVYVFRQHSRKSGWISLLASSLPVIVLHWVYWPNILQLWAAWIPSRLIPSMQAFRFPAAQIVTGGEVTMFTSLLPLLQGFRFHFFALFSFIVCLLLWPHRQAWKSRSHARAAEFLAALFLILALLHAWATISQSNQGATCTYCFTPYLAFFEPLALLLFSLVATSWKLEISKLSRILLLIGYPLFSAGLGYASYDRLGPWMLGIRFPAITRGLDPRRWFPPITLWDIAANKFQLDYWTSRIYAALIAGFMIGCLLLLFFFLIHRAFGKRYTLTISYGAFLLLGSLALGAWISPLMGGTYRQDGLCRADNPAAYRQAGQDLAAVIPPGSRVSWEASNAVPLLYLPGVQVNYPQLYALFSFRLGGDAQLLARHGLWNDQLADQWRQEADFIVSEPGWDRPYHPGGELGGSAYKTDAIYTRLLNPCDPQSYLVIYPQTP